MATGAPKYLPIVNGVFPSPISSPSIAIWKALKWISIQWLNRHCTFSIREIRYGSRRGRRRCHWDTIFRSLKMKDTSINIDLKSALSLIVFVHIEKLVHKLRSVNEIMVNFWMNDNSLGVWNGRHHLWDIHYECETFKMQRILSVFVWVWSNAKAWIECGMRRKWTIRCSKHRKNVNKSIKEKIHFIIYRKSYIQKLIVVMVMMAINENIYLCSAIKIKF